MRNKMADFHTVQVVFDDKVHAPHILFFKRHFSKETKEQRTIFISNNIPPYCNEDGLKNIFHDCGKIESIVIKENPHHSGKQDNSLLQQLQPKNNCFKMAHVVFKDEASMETVLALNPNEKRVMSTSTRPIVTGLNKWIEAHNKKFLPESTLQSVVDEFMRDFDKAQAEKEDAKTEEADDDGWVTIPVKNKISSEPNKTKRINKKLEKKKKKEKELMNFYLFQQREEKREKIATLRQKFMEDKKTIAQLRTVRKFKPF